MCWLNKTKRLLANFPKTSALALGCLSVAALPPYYLLPLLAAAFGGLMFLLLASPSPKKAFAVGYWFGFGHFACGLFWINNALMMDLPRLGWLIPLCFAGSGGFFGLFAAFPALFCRFFKGNWPRLLAFAAAWTFFEWIRSFIFTGFPWNLQGTVWAFSDSAIQAAALFGTYGLSLFTVIAAGVWGIPLFCPGRKNLVSAALFSALIPTLLFAYGSLRLDRYPDGSFSDVNIRIVQPAIPQQMKWKPEMLEQNLQTYIQMSVQDLAPQTDMIIWGETANPFVLSLQPQYLEQLLQAVPAGGYLVTGALDYVYDGEKWRPLNAMQALDGKGVAAAYGKSHLVPFGEYVPLRQYLPESLKPVTNVIADFMPGTGPSTVVLPQIPPFGILICYEIIFPAAVTDPAQRPQWLLNLTNDGWYGDSAGPRQHLVAARMRAVEEGLTVVRAANSGISALISKTGVVLRRLPLNASGTLDFPLPQSPSVETPYSKYHNLTVMLLCFLTVITAYALSKRSA